VRRERAVGGLVPRQAGIQEKCGCSLLSSFIGILLYWHPPLLAPTPQRVILRKVNGIDSAGAMKKISQTVSATGLCICIAIIALAGSAYVYWCRYAPGHFPGVVINYSPWIRPVLVAACNPGFQVDLKGFPERFPNGMTVIKGIVHNPAESSELKGMAGMAAFFYPGEENGDVILDLVEQKNESTLRLLRENFREFHFSPSQEARLRRWMEAER